MGEAKRRKQLLGENYGKNNPLKKTQLIVHSLTEHKNGDKWAEILVKFVSDLDKLEIPKQSISLNNLKEIVIHTVKNWLVDNIELIEAVRLSRKPTIVSRPDETFELLFALGDIAIANPATEFSFKNREVDSSEDLLEACGHILIAAWLKKAITSHANLRIA